MTKDEFIGHAMALYDFCDYPAVRYKILYSLQAELTPPGSIPMKLIRQPSMKCF